MITARNLRKSYGEKLVVNDLSFDVHPGSVTGFLGPNGAGKSTTMRLMLGLDHGDGYTYFDGKLLSEYRHPMRLVGAVLDARTFHPNRTARDHLRMLAAASGIPEERVDGALAEVGLESVADDRPKGFSLGMSQRLGLAGALLGNPKHLILDEPANGLDPQGIHWLRDFLKAYAATGRTVFVSSHLLSEMAMMADQLVVIGRGSCLHYGDVQSFVDRFAATSIVVRSPNLPDLVGLLRTHGAKDRPTGDGGALITNIDPGKIGELAYAHGIPLHELTVQTASLEEAFLQATEGQVEYQAAEPPLPSRPTQQPRSANASGQPRPVRAERQPTIPPRTSATSALNAAGLAAAAPPVSRPPAGGATGVPIQPWSEQSAEAIAQAQAAAALVDSQPGHATSAQRATIPGVNPGPAPRPLPQGPTLNTPNQVSGKSVRVDTSGNLIVGQGGQAQFATDTDPSLLSGRGEWDSAVGPRALGVGGRLSEQTTTEEAPLFADTSKQHDAPGLPNSAPSSPLDPWQRPRDRRDTQWSRRARREMEAARTESAAPSAPDPRRYDPLDTSVALPQRDEWSPSTSSFDPVLPDTAEQPVPPSRTVKAASDADRFAPVTPPWSMDPRDNPMLDPLYQHRQAAQQVEEELRRHQAQQEAKRNAAPMTAAENPRSEPDTAERAMNRSVRRRDAQAAFSHDADQQRAQGPTTPVVRRAARREQPRDYDPVDVAREDSTPVNRFAPRPSEPSRFRTDEPAPQHLDPLTAPQWEPDADVVRSMLDREASPPTYQAPPPVAEPAQTRDSSWIQERKPVVRNYFAGYEQQAGEAWTWGGEVLRPEAAFTEPASRESSGTSADARTPTAQPATSDAVRQGSPAMSRRARRHHEQSHDATGRTAGEQGHA